VEEGEDRRQKVRQRAETLSAHTVKRVMCCARAVLAFRDEYDLFGRVNICLGVWGTNKTETSERNGVLYCI
jgi:hypothetical protein